jgi:predicted PhzF superfamily epimerase YddE/YHI9
MQAIAAEMNLSETAFFAPDLGGSSFRIRRFTPSREVDLIGNATLAAGHLVFERLEPSATRVRFLSADAELIVSRRDAGPAGARGAALTLEMPALRPQPRAAPPSLARALARQPTQVLAAKHYLCVFGEAEEVGGLRPDMALLAGLDLPGVIVTAPAVDEVDFVSRFFAPANGVPEDPVSGVAHVCLAPYWSERLGKRKLIGRQLSRRGGLVHCQDLGARVELGGNAVTVLEGRLRL